MHPGNEANQDDRQILRRPILLAICEGGEQNHLHFSGSSSVAGRPAFPPFAKSAKDGAPDHLWQAKLPRWQRGAQSEDD